MGICRRGLHGRGFRRHRTSPLYTLQVATKAASPSGDISPQAVLGVVSLIFWSLIIVISIKYAILIMRADNHGEGGILALLALVSPRRAKHSRRRAVMVVVGLIGATLLYGDGTITPAISVLSALEGIKLYAPQMERYVVPLTVVIIVLLFVIQRKGTSWIGGIFGPIMFIWFVLIGILGIGGIARAPAILAALSPLPAITYLWHAGPLALAVIGGAFLAVTGGEAFYADMGHFGPFPIRVAWFGVALPALTLNYFGQGGLLLTEPGAVENSFYQLAPAWSHYGLVALATVATVIASQSIISGAYSLTRQAIQLGFLPRLNIVHTAGHEIGQIYVPVVNWALAVRHPGRRHRLPLVGSAGRSLWHRRVVTDGDHDADGDVRRPALEAQSDTRLRRQRQPARARSALCRLDVNETPGRRLVPVAHLVRHRLPHAHLAQGRGDHGQSAPGSSRSLRRSSSNASTEAATSRPGTAVVLGRMAKGVPLALSRNLKCNRVLHENVLLVAVTRRKRRVGRRSSRGHSDRRWHHPRRAAFRFHGGAERSQGSRRRGGAPPDYEMHPSRVTYFTGRETLIATGRRPGLARWREAIFALMHHNAQRPGAYFKIPSAQIMEIGVEFEI